MSTNGSNGDKPPVGSENINTDIVTLTRFLTEEQTKHKEATGDFTYALRYLISATFQLTMASDYFAMPSNLRSRAFHTTSDEPP